MQTSSSEAQKVLEHRIYSVVPSCDVRLYGMNTEPTACEITIVTNHLEICSNIVWRYGMAQCFHKGGSVERRSVQLVVRPGAHC